jgi:uncharacterized repeat protein (TIGR01451 family)
VLVYSSYLGGSGEDQGHAIAVDGAGSAYLTGHTESANFPTQSPLQGALGGGSDAFVAKLNPAGNALVYSTYLGGSDFDEGCGIAVDGAGRAYLTGETRSTNFPTLSPLQGAFGGGSSDAFVARVLDGADLRVELSDAPDPATAGDLLTYTITATNLGPDLATGVTVSDSLPFAVSLVSVTASQGSCTLGTAVVCALGSLAVGAGATVSIGVRPGAGGLLSNTASVAGDQPDADATNNTAAAVTTVQTPTATATPTASPTVTATGTATATATAMATPTSTATPTATATATPPATATATGTPTPTTTPTPLPGLCVLRPPVDVVVQPVEPGRLAVALSARTSDGTLRNFLRALYFDALTNARIEAGGQVSAAPFAVVLPGATEQTTFRLERLTAGQASTVQLTVVDDCGSWPTLVGGGPGAF